jgi:hypothetical protein
VVATNSGAQQDPAFWLLQPHPIQSETVVTALGCAFQENKYLYTGSYWFIKKIQQATKQRQEIVHVTRTPLLITRQQRFIQDALLTTTHHCQGRLSTTTHSCQGRFIDNDALFSPNALLTTTLYCHQRSTDDDILIDNNSLLSTTLY